MRHDLAARRALPAAAAVALVVGLTACAADTAPKAPEPAPSASPSVTASATPSASPSASPSPTGTALSNACPDVGCRVHIASVKAAPGGELTLDFEANYAPDMSHNHVHVYWDHFTAEQVSDDSQTRFHVATGDWVPTGDDPYTTAEAASVSKRGTSTRICVTAGDRDHNVLDPKLYECTDVSALV